MPEAQSVESFDAIMIHLMAEERLPETYSQTVQQILKPLADKVAAWRAQIEDRPLLLGLNGAQGTGKSTLTRFLCALLEHFHGLRTAAFSLDDIYLTHAERQTLGKTVHPLFRTRGVPGTHDLGLGEATIKALCEATPTSETALPFFDKAQDDRAPRERWPVFTGQPDVILVEGWCLSARGQRLAELKEPLNQLEADEDMDGTWRSHVNERLLNDYRQFFDQFDRLVMLKAPSMECVRQWRTLQEHKLARKQGGAPGQGGSRLMTDQEVLRFVMHYERVTRCSLDEIPQRADALIKVDSNHCFTKLTFKSAD